MSTAPKAEGPWEPLYQVVDTAGWEDPCPFWDEDGQAYLGHSKVGAGPIIVHKMSPDGKKLLDDGVTVYTGPVAEGTKIHKLNGYYYMSIPEGGVEHGWQTILRSKNIYGPYEKKVVLEKGSTEINGPHQGALIDLPNGDWWFMHFQSLYSMGRVVHLQPMYWKDGWPVIGVDMDMNGIGEPVYVWKKPDVGMEYPVTAPQTSDEFNKPELSFQWAWNHNPVKEAWSLTQQEGYLSFSAQKSASLKEAKNTLTQKLMGKKGEVTTLLLTDKMENGQKAGLCFIGRQYNAVGIIKENDKLVVFADLDGKVTRQPFKSEKIYLRVEIAATAEIYPWPIRDKDRNIIGYHDNPEGGTHQFYYSADNKTFHPLGEKFFATFANWKGPKLGLFSYNENEEGGTALFDWFRYEYDGPKPGYGKQ
jgi:beta-xylosidase